MDSSKPSQTDGMDSMQAHSQKMEHVRPGEQRKAQRNNALELRNIAEF